MDTQENEIYVAVLIASVTIGLIILYFIRSMIKQQRRNLELQKKNIVAEVNALERERGRIATDLHDEVGPVLAGIKLKINSLDVGEDDQELIDRTSENIDRVLQRMREISFDLMPQALLRNGLVSAIRQLVDFVATDSLAVSFGHDENIILSEEKSIHVYRIVQEVLHNTIKHAKASELQLSMRRNGKGLSLKIRDNGVGFSTAHPEEFAGFGLRSMLSRSELLGGIMYLESAPGKGTEYQFEIPI